MSIFDELKGKAGGLKDKAAVLVGNNADSIKGGIGKVGDFIDNKTGGKYSGQVDGLQAKASELIDRAPGNNGSGRAGGVNPPAS
ncbi:MULTISPECIES: antitoxin [Arthrobacter]|uniref:antitoxin n=1 Tax=Arthrobacter TaxID=1663 RepID=UPI00222F7A30|nr:antitoxin [Arthrobacter mangrovi]